MAAQEHQTLTVEQALVELAHQTSQMTELCAAIASTHQHLTALAAETSSEVSKMPQD